MEDVIFLDDDQLLEQKFKGVGALLDAFDQQVGFLDIAAPLFGFVLLHLLHGRFEQGVHAQRAADRQDDFDHERVGRVFI